MGKVLANEPERERIKVWTIKHDEGGNEWRTKSLVQRLTDGPDDGLLQLPLLVSFDDLGADAGAAVVRAGQLVVHAQTELPQQRVEHLQHRGACKHSGRSNTHIKKKNTSDRQKRFPCAPPVPTRAQTRNAPTEPLAAMAAASSRTSTMPARTLAEFLLLASRWPRSCWMTRWECWDWRERGRILKKGFQNKLLIWANPLKTKDHLYFNSKVQRKKKKSLSHEGLDRRSAEWGGDKWHGTRCAG